MIQDISKMITAGLSVLSSDEVRVPTSQVEDLAGLKEILRAVLNGKLVLASPDRVLPEGEEKPNKEIKLPKDNGE